jgi:hypothetical protein
MTGARRRGVRQVCRRYAEADRQEFEAARHTGERVPVLSRSF